MCGGMRWEGVRGGGGGGGGKGGGRGDGDGWTEVTVRYSSCTLEHTSC